jgi:hypothetical protein
MSIFDVFQAGQIARLSGIPVSVLNEKEILKFAQSVEHQVVYYLKSNPNLYDYNQVDIERDFKLAATNSGILVLADMKVPSEQRPEGQLNAVSRGLYIPGEKHAGYDDGIAPGFYEQFKKEFSREDRPRFVAFLSVERYRTINTDSFEPMWNFKIRYSSIQ